VSVIAALTLSPRRRRVGLLSHTLPDASFRGATVAAFLRRLLRRVRGRVIVVWDNWSGHGGPDVRAVLAAHPRLTVERLPPYAPTLNPVEHLWSQLKWGAVCNFAPADAAELDAAVRPALARLARSQPLLRGCWRGARLHIPGWRC
jgi:DDE superfamily endonuclease